MTSQPPLLDPIGPALPSPLFTPRPGWGGKLHSWLADNAYLIVFRLVLLCAVVLIVRSFWITTPSRTTTISPTPSVSPGLMVLTAQPGDGITVLAAHAIDLRLAAGPAALRLDAVQHLFAVDALARLIGWAPLNVGQEVRFMSSDITATILQALTLPPHQYAAWERVLRAY